MTGALEIALGWLACLLASAGAVGLAMAALPGLRTRAALHAATLEARLRYLQLPLRPARVLRIQLALGLLLSLLAFLWVSPVPLMPLPLVVLGPSFWLRRKADERSALCEAQLDGWMLCLAGTLAATPALGDALSSTRKQVASPLGEELETCLRECELGTPLDRALEHMAERIGSATVTAALTILRVARNTGGDLSQTLETAAANLREMARLEGVVRTKTAEGRSQAFVVSVVPLALVAMLHMVDPDFLAPLWSEPRGHMVVAGACALWLAAVVWAQRIVAVEI